MKLTGLLKCCFFAVFFSPALCCMGSTLDTIYPRYQVTLREALMGNLEIDTKLLDSYELLPENIRQFYLEVRAVFVNYPAADFSHPEIVSAALKNDIVLMGGPMLGNLGEDRVTIWVRPSTNESITVKVSDRDDGNEKFFAKDSVEAGVDTRIPLNGLTPDTKYDYTISINNRIVAKGGFKTSPMAGTHGQFRLAFGSCFHKIGLHNPNLIQEILKREPAAMMLLGDIAVNDRENQINMHRSDYQLRDLSKPWRQLAGNIPIYSSWDDHDYFNNDLSGIPEAFNNDDRDALRMVWKENWNNPENDNPGIYFSTRIGPVEIIMLDTRSLRENENSGNYGSYLGVKQLSWLKETLKSSYAPFKVISSGTMWSDYITPGKDSWGTWDTQARDELFGFIEAESISGVLLISGDRHGARGFTIPRPSGFVYHEFEVASLGGVPGPDAMAMDASNQLFGYHGIDETAFGEFVFDTSKIKPIVMFRLINEFGEILEEYILPYKSLTP